MSALINWWKQGVDFHLLNDNEWKSALINCRNKDNEWMSALINWWKQGVDFHLLNDNQWKLALINRWKQGQ